MPKREEPSGNNRSKMTVVMFQTEGGDATIQEAFRTASLAMTSLIRTAQVGKVPRALPPQAVADHPATGDAVDATECGLDSAQEHVPEEISNDVIRPAKHRYFRTPQIINDLDLITGTPTLEDFLNQKEVGDNDSKRCLAIAAWLKENRGITEIGGDHIHTCYRSMGWGTPKDVTSTLRTLKKSDCFAKGTKPGTYAINHIGESRVLKMAES